MKRRIVKQGGNSYTITLPKTWIDKNELNVGDEIEVEDINNTLSILSNKSVKIKNKKEISLEINEENSFLLKIFLWGIYRLGYERVHIKFKYNSEDLNNQLLDIVEHQLIGYEIIRECDNEFLIENLTEPIEEDSKVIFRRIFVIISQSLKNLKKFTEDGNFDTFSQIQKYSYKINQFDNLNRRIIIKSKSKNETSIFVWQISNYLLLLQHSILHFHNILKKENLTIENEEIQKYIDEIIETFNKFETAYFKEDLLELSSYSKKFHQISDSLIHIELQNKTDKLFSHYFREFCKNIYLMSTPISSKLLLKNLNK